MTLTLPGVVGGRHSSASVDHFTPPAIVEAARATLGAIDLDPASCAAANRIVRATRFLTEEDDGLSLAWSGRVEAAVFVMFSLELLQVAQVDAPCGLPLPSDVPMCIPSSRLAYYVPTGQVGLFSEIELQEGKAPPHASAILFLPPRKDAAAAFERFAASFAPFGAVIVNACCMR